MPLAVNDLLERLRRSPAVTWRENQAMSHSLHAAKLKGACVEEIDYRTSRGLDKEV